MYSGVPQNANDLISIKPQESRIDAALFVFSVSDMFSLQSPVTGVGDRPG